MKVISVDGKQTGKLGGRVYYVNRGVNISREYTEEVHNPNTPAQVGQRARFKLASQVSAAMAPVIAIPRKGIQSPRNLFVKRNMGFFYADGQGADVNYEGLQITLGYTPLPAIYLERVAAGIAVGLYEEPAKDIARVVYCMFLRDNDGKLSFMGSKISTDRSGREYSFDTLFASLAGNIVVYAYGMRDNSVKATAKYEEYKIESGLDIARLVASRKINSTDYSFTATNAASLRASDTETTEPVANNIVLDVWSNNGSSVSVVIDGGNPILTPNGHITCPIGSTVVVQASNELGWSWDGFYNNGEQTPFTTVMNFTFTAKENRSVLARFTYGTGLE